MRLLRVVSAAIILTLLLAAPASAGNNADLSVTKVDGPDPVAAGANITYGITVTNSATSTSTANNVSLSDPLPAGTTFASFTGPAGWTLTTPAVGGTGTVMATNPALAQNASAAFTLVINVDAGIKPGIITNTATVTSTVSDSDPANNAATATTTVTGPAASVPASVPDAAMAASRPGSPLTSLGFAALLVGLLATTAVMAARRSRT